MPSYGCSSGDRELVQHTEPWVQSIAQHKPHVAVDSCDTNAWKLKSRGGAHEILPLTGEPLSTVSDGGWRVIFLKRDTAPEKLPVLWLLILHLNKPIFCMDTQ